MKKRAKDIGATEQCPIFENTCPGPYIRAGALVEGLGSGFEVGGKATTGDLGTLCVRILGTGDRLDGFEHRTKAIEHAGYDAYAPWLDHLLPLTRAAEEMKAARLLESGGRGHWL